MNIFEYVEKANKELACDELAKYVRVEHTDGSLFTVKNAKVEKRICHEGNLTKLFVIVFSEHHRPLFWAENEVKVTVLK